MLIQWAYQLDEGRLSGVPSGFDALRFDVVAKAPEQEPVAGQMQLMMRALLASVSSWPYIMRRESWWRTRW